MNVPPQAVVTRKRLRDLFFYIAIGLAFSLAIVWGSFQSNRSGTEVFGKWGGLAANTLIVFGYAIRQYRTLLRKKSFWAMVLAVISVHLALFIYTLQVVDVWRLAWWVIITPIEYVIIVSALVALGYRTSSLDDQN